MASYKVTSDRVEGKKRGDTVHDSDFVGVNVDALLAGGHIEPVRGGKSDKISLESEQ